MHYSQMYHTSSSLYLHGLSSILLPILVQTSALGMNEGDIVGRQTSLTNGIMSHIDDGRTTVNMKRVSSGSYFVVVLIPGSNNLSLCCHLVQPPASTEGSCYSVTDTCCGEQIPDLHPHVCSLLPLRGR